VTDVRAPLQDALGDRYEVLGEVGRGGMATVYRARDRRMDRTVAVKVLHPQLAFLLGSERFRREVSIVGALQHPNIVPVYESGDHDGLLFFTMPLVDGETLRGRLERETPVPLDEAFRIAEDVAQALDYAHGHGIVHRDIKPENILLSGRCAMVADFGVARAITEAGEDRLTSAGIAVGTPAYMSPEQAAGGEHVDGRSDIYALGCVLYEMLSGEPPFTGPSAQAVLARQIQEPPRSLRVVRRTVSPALQQVVEKALAKLPADRYATAGAFVAALERARLSPERRGALAWLQRHHRAALATLVVLVGLGLAARIGISRSAYADGRRAFEQWDLTRAQRLLRRAVAANPANAPAHFWLAEAAVLQGKPPAEWRASAHSAVAFARQLPTGRDSALAMGLLAMADSQFPSACATYDALLRRDSLDVIAWFGRGECQRRDRAVVRDRASTTGWRFRSSYQGAVLAYQRALEIAPSLNLAFGAVAYERLAQLLVAEPTLVRMGAALPPDTGLFIAYPALDHDSLLLVPHRAAAVAIHAPPSRGAAVAKGRALLADLVTRWAAASPRSAAAHAALARALELRGQLAEDATGRPGALTEIREARRLESDPTLGLRHVLAEIRLELKLERFGRARQLADSILAAHPAPDSSASWYLACAAALVGRAHRAAALYARTASDTSFDSPMARTREAPLPAMAPALRLLAYAALGAPLDSLAALEQQVDTALRRYVEPGRREAVRHQLEDVSDLMAFPLRGLRPADRPAGPDFLSVVEWSLARGDTAAARARLAQAQQAQASFGPGNLLPAHVYLQAWLSLAVGDTAGARWLLELSLENLAAAPTMLVGEPQQAAALVHAMALRARLAHALGDRATARRWAARVDTLWSGSDLPQLRALVNGLIGP
jgi:tRNA A-37 threonylcarbamoyl transferase component Bud32/tetratricopeptide (TPR) repeat protein